MRLHVVLPIIFALLFSAFSSANDKDGSHIQPDNLYPRVKMETSMGDIVVELNRSRAPITVNNFLRYVEKRSYEDTIFHRVIPGFVVQGGGYDVDMQEKPSFKPIFNESGNGMKNGLYTIAMARQNDPHTANRQFYFNLGDNTNLDPGRDWGYAVFGTLVEGYEVVEAISQVETDYDLKYGWPNVPKEPVILKKVTVLPEAF
ncbi:peptidylprolyl isomerase [Aestuariibacter salexigens]|uniref:peptidylprolyl isomerase n=1 Tax=Aestuariibacter salexigens TaxID=226010 RepID=UPI0004149B52|nr:peptidylprolyl isomerase [Aestuariibacter salexigens]